MSSKLVFHIGCFKGGSTAIQSTLAFKTYDCGSRSILYPGIGPTEGQEKSRGQHGALASTLFPTNLDNGKRQERFSRIADNIAAVGADISVISAEKFEYVDPRLLAETITEHFGGFDNLQVVVYVRPHAERLLAEFAERVKHGLFQGNMDELHAKTKPLSGPRQRGFFYHPRLSLWREVFGDRLTVRPMVRAHLERSDVVSDFFAQILDGAEFSVTEAPRSNVSPSLEDLSVVRAFHRACGEAKATREQERVGIQLIQCFSELPAENATRLALHVPLARDVVDTYAGDAEALDRDFFDATPMQDALAEVPRKAVDRPQALEAADHLDSGQMRLVAAWVRTAAQLAAQAGRQGPGKIQSRL